MRALWFHRKWHLEESQERECANSQRTDNGTDDGAVSHHGWRKWKIAPRSIPLGSHVSQSSSSPSPSSISPLSICIITHWLYVLQTHTQTCIKYLCREREGAARTIIHRGEGDGVNYTHICYLNLARWQEKSGRLNAKQVAFDFMLMGTGTMPVEVEIARESHKRRIQRICLFGNKFTFLVHSLSLESSVCAHTFTRLPATELGSGRLFRHCRSTCDRPDRLNRKT